MMRCILIVTFVLWGSFAMAGQSAQELVLEAIQAFERKRTKEAVELLSKAIEQDPKNVKAYRVRAQVQEATGKFREAAADFTKVLELDPKEVETYHQRGCVEFKAGKIKESVADFDKYLELKPDRKASHWQRGISFYYAGQYDDGRKQFEGYQTFDNNDVENAVWRYMCMARSDGTAKAKKAMLKIGEDKRVPMRQVYEMFSGLLKPEDVIAAAKAGQPSARQLNQQMFYAHLYVGIHYEIEVDKQKALAHLNLAADEHRIGHYMWDVARVHRDLLKKVKEKK